MPPKAKEYVASYIVLDVGATSSGSGYFDQARKVASQFVQRKIYSEANFRYGLVLVGTVRASNDLGYPRVTVVRPPGSDLDLVQADFSLVKFLEEDVRSYVGVDVEDADWLDGLVVAMDRLVQNTAESPGCTVRRIIMMTDMGCEVDDDKLAQITQAITDQQIDVSFILPDWMDEEEEEENEGDDDDDQADEDVEEGDDENDQAVDREPAAAAGTSRDQANIGDEGGSREGKKPKTANQVEGCAIMEHIGQVCQAPMESLACPLAQAQAMLTYKEQRKKRPFPWKVDLELGPELKIPATGYIATRRETAKTWKRSLGSSGTRTAATAEEDPEMKPETVLVRDNEDQAVIDAAEVISAYRYGSEVVPLGDTGASAYEGGPKSMAVLGFVQTDILDISQLVGNGSMIFQATEGDDFSIVAMSNLVRAMVAEGVAALVRKVYRKGSAPQMGLLIAEEDKSDEEFQEEDGGSRIKLVYVQVAYDDDLRHFQFAPLWNDKTQPSPEQLDAMDDLIESMMMTSEETSALKRNTVNPYQQHLFNCLTARALNPSKGKKLPRISEEVKRLLIPTQRLAESAQLPAKKIKDLFKLEPVSSGTAAFKKAGNSNFGGGSGNQQSGERVFGAGAVASGSGVNSNQDGGGGVGNSETFSLDLDSSMAVTSVTSVNPVQDFRTLLSKGIPFESLAQQMEKVVFNLVKASADRSADGDEHLLKTEKIVSCLEAYREASTELRKPSSYNAFLREVKSASAETVLQLWKQVVDKNLGLIDSRAVPESKVSPQEAEDFLRKSGTGNDDNNDVIAAADSDKADEDEDLLDDL